MEGEFRWSGSGILWSGSVTVTASAPAGYINTTMGVPVEIDRSSQRPPSNLTEQQNQRATFQITGLRLLHIEKSNESDIYPLNTDLVMTALGL